VMLRSRISRFSYAGNIRMPITSELKIVKPGGDTPSGIWPVFRMMVCPMICVVLSPKDSQEWLHHTLTHPLFTLSISHTG
jgi:hypothetical protein